MEFHRSTSASRQSRLSSHLNATDVSRGAITSDGRLLTRTGLYRAAPAAPAAPAATPTVPQPCNPTPSYLHAMLPTHLDRCLPTLDSTTAPFLRKLSTTHRFVSFVSVRLCVTAPVYRFCSRLASVFIRARTNTDAIVTKPRKAHGEKLREKVCVTARKKQLYKR